MPALAPANRKKLLLRLGLALVIAAAVGLFLLKGLHLHEVIDRGVRFLSSFGPWTFFTAMALLPAFGVPASVFTLTAGSAFAPRMGMTGVVAAGAAATVINFVLTYWLARFVFRQRLAKLLERLGYKLPKVEGADVTDLVIILRVTTGIPFFVQNYTLGLVDAPFARYFILSCIFTLPNNAAFIIFGDALLHGRGGTVLIAFSLIIALTAATHFLRRHYGQKKKRLAAA